MKVNGTDFRTIWENPENNNEIMVIDQTALPHKFSTVSLVKPDDFIDAIKQMVVRGAPLIGVTAAYGVYIASLNAPLFGFLDYIKKYAEKLIDARPTAVNLEWGVKCQLDILKMGGTKQEMIKGLQNNAEKMAEDDVKTNRAIGEYGLALIEAIAEKKKGETVNILTHCNAGWLATVDYGTALAPVFAANAKGIDIHVWVDETRPVMQGARLTSWELNNENIKNTIITDGTAGLLMQKNMVDMVIVGSDRTTANGDVVNKIGTYHIALAAKDNNIPFYAAVPFSTIDLNVKDPLTEIIIEERSIDEIKYFKGLSKEGIAEIVIAPENSQFCNYAFDITPAKVVTGIITERGICNADRESISGLLNKTE